MYTRFQFLIGRLKTKAKHFALMFEFEFQFLIGRLKTAIEAIPLNEVAVSIPHR